MPKYKIHGFLYEPSCDGAGKDGYIHFWEVIEAPTQDEAVEMAKEDYGEYNTLICHGTVANQTDEDRWLGQNA
jgi:hypothetical protein